jgi:hypothetical protein
MQIVTTLKRWYISPKPYIAAAQHGQKKRPLRRRCRTSLGVRRGDMPGALIGGRRRSGEKFEIVFLELWEPGGIGRKFEIVFLGLWEPGGIGGKFEIAFCAAPSVKNLKVFRGKNYETQAPKIQKNQCRPCRPRALSPLSRTSLREPC